VVSWVPENGFVAMSGEFPRATQLQKTYGAEAWARPEQYTGPLT
jgi:hypothetical protein